MLLSDDIWEQTLSFVIVDWSSWKSFSAASHQFHTISLAPVSWMGATIQLPGMAMTSEDYVKQVLLLASRWHLSKSLCLPAHPRRQSLRNELSSICPDLDISVAAQGPYLMFVMGCRCAVGEGMGLHFFEPRYRWMCQRLVETQRSQPGTPIVFAFVTGGGACPGSTGLLCEVKRFRSNPDGTFDVNFVARSSFSVLEAWCEDVPDYPQAPPLAVGLLDVDGQLQKKPAGGSAVSVAQSSHRVSARRTGCASGMTAQLARIFRCTLVKLRCCPVRR